MIKNKLFITIALVFVLGAATGLVINSPKASANFFDNFLKYFSVPANNTSNTSNPSNTAPVQVYSPTIDYEQAVIKAVEDSSPSVVSIIISKDVPIIEQCPYDPFSGMPGFSDLFGGTQFYQQCQKGTKLEKVGGGSGFIVSAEGLIITNKHVVSDTKAQYTVITSDGEKYDAKVLARDPIQDIALIKIEAINLKPATLGDADSIKLGQTAIAIGYSLGEFSNTVSAGVISGLSRTITASGSNIGSETIQGVIQTDAAINPGNSGGPLLNLKGEVIGINTAVASGAENIGFAIPINQAKKDIQSVKNTGTIKIAYLGVHYFTISPNTDNYDKLAVKEGALIKSGDNKPAVIVGSPADKAGLKDGDIITELNGEKLTNDKILGSALQRYSIGDTITLTVIRGSSTLQLKATLEERPQL